MQCNKGEDDPAGQPSDPPHSQEMSVKNFEGGEREPSGEKTEVSGQNSPNPPHSNSTQLPQTGSDSGSDNNNEKNSSPHISHHFNNRNNSNGAGEFKNKNCDAPSGQQQQCAVGRSEVAQNIDQFNNLNGSGEQSIDQFTHQQIEQQQAQAYQLVVQQSNVRARPHYPPPPPQVFHHQHQQAAGGPRQHQAQPQQGNFNHNFYPGGPGGGQHPTYPAQGGPSSHHLHSNCFQVNYQTQRAGGSYEDGSEDLDTNNSNNCNSSGQNPHCHQFSLRARRRVRQRVDAGEPRNSYSSIPGFSFRQHSMMSRAAHGSSEEFTSGFYRGGPGGVFSMRGRGRHLPGGQHQPLPPPLPPYSTHLPFSRYRHPSLVQQHPPPFPLAAAAAVHRALFLGPGGVRSGGSPVVGGGRGPCQPALADLSKTPETLRDQTAHKVDVTPPLSTPPSTPPLVDSEQTKVKINSSDCLSDPSHSHSTESPTITNKNTEFSQNISKNALLIREILSSKLAAVTDMMEQGFGLVATAHNGPRDFSQHSLPINNNELKENQAAQIMSHLLKVRQEMALNMSKDSDSDRHTESPGHISDNDIIEEEKDEPINLHQNGRSSAGGSGSDGETSPASPSSDAGNSTSSAKEQKASRLENIVGGLARSTSSPLPPQGCKKRKLYQPVQHDVTEEELKDNERREEPEQKKMKDGLENHIKSMQDQFQKMQEKFYNNHNDENADPEDAELQIDLSQEEKKLQREEITIERRLNPKSFASFPGHPLLNGSAEPLPLPPTTLNPNYMDLAKRFLQEKQDQLTKEMITRDIVDSTIGKNEIAEKLKAISPELEGLADILKSELKTSLTIIVDSIVQRFLTQKRQPLSKFSENSMFGQDPKSKTPSGRAPQVRDRSTPRTIQNPISVSNPISLSNSLVSTNNLVMTGTASTAPPRISFPTSVSGDLSAKPAMMSLYTSNGQMSEDEKDDESEQDDALNLTVTPKKKRHKVTDTRITPRTVSRLLGDQPSIADLQKHFGPGSPFGMPPGFLPRPPFPGMPGSFLPNIPTSLTPSLSSLNNPAEHFPFSPFGFPGHLNRPRDLSPPSRPRSASPPRDPRPPPPLIHPAILAAHSPDFPHMRQHNDDNTPSSETGSDDLKMEFGNSPFSLGNMSGQFSPPFKCGECMLSVSMPSERQSSVISKYISFSFQGLLVCSALFLGSVSISWLGQQSFTNTYKLSPLPSPVSSSITSISGPALPLHFTLQDQTHH